MTISRWEGQLLPSHGNNSVVEPLGRLLGLEPVSPALLGLLGGLHGGGVDWC